MLVSQYNELIKIKRDVNTRRFNSIQLKRKLRLAMFVPFVRLKKVAQFNNKIKIVS